MQINSQICENAFTWFSMTVKEIFPVFSFEQKHTLFIIHSYNIYYLEQS